MTRRALIIAFFFPPDGGGGSQRWSKFCKRLPEFGWTPTVLTRALPASRTRWDPEDRSLLADADATEVHRVEAAGPTTSRWPALAGDLPRGWLDAAFEKARALCAERRFDVVVVTAPPYDLSRMALALTDAIDAPVVLDLRDPWALDGGRLFSNAAAWRRERDLMRSAFERCDGLILNTPEARIAAEGEFGQSAQRVAVIPNGYDGDDLRRLSTSERRDDGFRLVHLGTLHSFALYELRGIAGLVRRLRRHRPQRVDLAGRTLEPLLEAIHRLRQRGAPLGSAVRVRVVGPVDAATERCVRESPAPDAVELLGYRPHGEALREASEADALFLPLYGLPRGERARIVPGKTYEYLALGRRILACVPPGDARDLVERTGRAALADPCDPDEIAQALERLQSIDPDPPPAWPPDWVRRFERRAQTAELVDFLASAVDASEAVRKVGAA